MSLAGPAFTYRLAFRPVDEQMTSAELARTVMRALLALSGPGHGVSIVSIQRPPREDASGLYMEAVASGPEQWYLKADDYLLSQGLRGELLP
ncbi:MAG TPA: hypothetical protein DDZ67_07735 [Xanthomonadaceae bacterium]|nr:hypothetical protein [Xanthomonadaceae bacterium]